MKRLNCVLALGLLFVAVPPATAQELTSAPATRSTAAADPQRLNDLIKLIEGPNIPPPARRTGARELLLLGWAQAPARLTAILSGQNAAAKMAVALALADVPNSLAATYIDPLMTMLGDPAAAVRHAAAVALAGYRDHGVSARLRATVLNESEPLPRRLAAIEALGMMTQRGAVAALVEALRDPEAAICQPALQALEQVTALSFHGDVTAARAWWKTNENLSPAQWQQAQIDRLVQQGRELRRRSRELERRLVEAFREGYVRASEAERATSLQSHLTDGSPAVRLFGLDLVQSHLGEGKPLSAEGAAQVRVLLADAEPEVRAAAVQAVARLRDAADADRFLELLAGERHVKVRRALVNGLGYVGTGAVAQSLLGLLENADDSCLTEAVAALGRLAERGVLGAEWRDATVEALLATFGRTQPAQVALRERVLWAMSVTADPRFGAVFVAALAETETATVRQAAVRGIATLRDAKLADALIPPTRDPDTAIRRPVVELLAELASGDEHLAALWPRCDPAQESDQHIRRAAWRGVVRLLSGRSAAQVEPWVARLPQEDPARAQRALELLKIIEASLTEVPAARGDLGRIRARIAAELAALKQFDEALAAYLAALGDLHAVESAEIQPLALELLCFALVNGRYDQTVSSALAAGNPPLDGMALWNGVMAQIEQRLSPQKVDEAIAMLTALQTRPPAAFPPEVAQAIEQMLQRAHAVKNPPPSTAPASQPSTTPASQPATPPG